MYDIIFLLGLALIWIVFATVQDLRKREVADWLNFSLIIFALGFRFFYCLFDAENFGFFYQGLIGLGIFFVLGNLFYYTHLFAGGDAKLMIALGAILPFSNSLLINLRIFLMFFIIFLFAGSFYGLVWSIFLTIKNFKKFRKEFYTQFFENKLLIYFIMFFGLIIMFFGFFKILMFILGALIFIFPFFYLWAKSVEKVCMIKRINPKELTEGDWLYRDVKIKGKTIRAKWDGLSKKEIALIKQTKEQILIKQGIPFIPVFLISFFVFSYLYFLWDSLWQFNIF